MTRLNIDRQMKLEPLRMAKAIEAIEKKGYGVTQVSDTELTFMFMMHAVHYFPYSGWASGSQIKDGRGLKKLLRQI